MMDRSACKAIADKHLLRMMRLVGVSHWTIAVSFDATKEGTKATCEVFVKYERAEITIDAQKAETPLDVLESLRHELFHVLLANFEVYFQIVQRATKEQELVDLNLYGWQFAQEKTVLNMERACDWCFDYTGETHPLSKESMAKWLEETEPQKEGENAY
jgi:hypothetical protein